VNRAAWLVAATLALGGCVAAPRAPDGTAAPDPAALHQWTAAGRMAVAAGEEGGNGSFTWQQDEATTRLDLRGPLGAGGVRLVMAPESLSLTDGSGRVLDSAAARAELQARLGTDLPWGQLRYWMLGLAAPGEAAAVQESGAAPWRVSEQSDWRLAYDSFVTVRGVSLPQRFSAQRGAVRLRVVVDSWSTGQ
jgi:outer membrane lipoprotein LolB